MQPNQPTLGSWSCKCRSSDRLHRLVCDRQVWLHLLKQTADFSQERLEELFNFVPKKMRSELMPEVVRAAAGKLPPSDPWRGSPFKIIWTVQGWDDPQTLELEPESYDGPVYSNLKKLKNVAKAVKVTFTILEVHGWDFSDFNNRLMITDHVKQQGSKLANCEMNRIMFMPYSSTLFPLQRMSMKWKIKEVYVKDVDSLFNLDFLSLDDGHISSLNVVFFDVTKPMKEKSLDPLKKVWGIADEMRFCMGPYGQ